MDTQWTHSKLKAGKGNLLVKKIYHEVFNIQICYI